MRRLQFVFLCLASVALAVRAEDDAQNENAEVMDNLDDNIDIDLSRMMGDLFDFDVNEDAALDGDDAADSDREGRARDASEGSDKAMTDPKDLSRFNSFIDTFFRRLNSYSRTRFDPLGFAIAKKGANSKTNKKKDAKGDKGKKGKKKSAKKGKSKKGSRHPKDLDLGEVEEPEEVEESREKREVSLVAIEFEDEEDVDEAEEEEEQVSLDRVQRDVREAPQEEEEAGLAARKGKPAGKKGNKNKGAKKSSKSKKSKKGKKKGGKKKSSKKGGKKGRKSPKGRTTRAFVTGLATLARNGDVIVRNSENSKMIKADFRMGPIDLKVSRKFGNGKDAVVRNARAASPLLEGRIAIKISPNGKAKVSAFKVKKPAIVKVDGTLSRADKDSAKNNFMENSIGRFAPVAAQRLKIASRAVLKEAEPKNHE